MATPPLTEPEIAAALRDLPGWSRDGDALTRTYEFADFREAMAFLLRAAFEAEALDHHPEWSNVYRRVTIRLTTHDAGHRISAKDLELARRLARLARSG